ncbi:Chloride channel protein [Cystobacter fuscus DSM 2262]|uniref:Chloride channel protein n=1 Tax=Cystobacter fuscus (strain ATCC 25194 / DSM 2262 / NBRC 100088 / M29) TaxID=1242864 RepID=S9PAL7_CYSF2|nr:chloride channel protein [Cystobacter fuscus]EPX61450.1 Chloride channel protein [Cystobacter fuscus DSM 2262]
MESIEEGGRSGPWARVERWVLRLLALTNRLRLPGPSVLPVAGALVGLYSGLAAGLFANLIGLVSGIALGFPKLLDALDADSPTRAALRQAFAEARWEFEFLLVGIPLGLSALMLSRLIQPGGPRSQVKHRLEVLGLLMLGALSLYYPLVALAATNSVLGHLHDVGREVRHLPPWWVMLLPMLGGVLVGRVLRDRPETHGHGVPEVVKAVEREGRLPGRDGVLKLVASAITIGTGGSAGREGPIVFGGAAFGSEVGRTLGFTRRELAILLASGAGAGIAASFNAPIAGALFAMEIILREFQLRVFSPIILASVTATLVGRGVMGSAPMVRRVAYSMVSGWEIVFYALLGLVTGLLAYAFIRSLHGVETFFHGEGRGRWSARVGRLPLFVKAGLGGLVVGGLALVHPVVWGTGHESINDAAVRALSVSLLASGCLLKLVGTAITLGSGGSGGTFFPMTVMGALAGGAFGEVIHAALPGITAPSGAYAMVGMGGAVAALTRGPLTGLMMVYELSGNYAIILPLMVTCTIASALCHALVERRAGVDANTLGRIPVDELVAWVEPVEPGAWAPEVRERLLASHERALPVRDGAGTLLGVVSASVLEAQELRANRGTVEGWVRRVPAVSVETPVGEALRAMDAHEVDALPVRGEGRVGVVTRAGLLRFLQRERRIRQKEPPFSPTELPR